MIIKGLQVGQRIRVTSLQAARGWQGWQLVMIPAGREFDGTVQSLNADGFFELKQDNGDLQSFSAYDTSIAITPA